MLGTTLSQRQEVHQWLVCLGQKQTNKKTLEDGTPREFLGLAAGICIALPGEEVSWGLTRLGGELAAYFLEVAAFVDPLLHTMQCAKSST